MLAVSNTPCARVSHESGGPTNVTVAHPDGTPTSIEVYMHTTKSYRVHYYDLSPRAGSSERPYLPRSRVNPFKSAAAYTVSPTIGRLPSVVTSLERGTTPAPHPVRVDVRLKRRSPGGHSTADTTLISLPAVANAPITFSASIFDNDSLRPGYASLHAAPLNSAVPIATVPVPEVNDNIRLVDYLRGLVASSALRP